MTVKEIIKAIERVAPLRLQDEWDNSGLQVGFMDNGVSKVLVCLDVTEDIVDEAAEKGCQMIVSHHPLLFKPLSLVSDVTYQQRCVVKALAKGIAVYSSHTSMDNARGGVNYKIAELIGLQGIDWLLPKDGEDAGSGIIGSLSVPERDSDFLRRLKRTFGVECLRHSVCSGKEIRTVAVCGGSGAFLMKDALRKGADCFVTGEFHYHDYFENGGMLLAELGHFQSEQYTMAIFTDILEEAFPELEVLTYYETNPILYDAR